MSAVGFQSDSYQLVETCLAKLRVDARLDDDPILPSIEVLPEADVMDVDMSELVIVCDSVRELPSAASIVRESVKANTARTGQTGQTGRTGQKDVPTLRRIKAAAPASASMKKNARWPVILCALVATYCGVTAFIKSPLGAKPEVQHVVKIARGHVAGALHTTKSLVRL